MMYKNIFKRILDFMIALLLLILLSLVIVMVYILLKLECNQSVITTKKKIGRNNKSFNVYYFRTGLHRCNKKSHSINRTKLGLILKKTKLYLIPHLFNIIKGDMSFIGPVPWDLEKVNDLDDSQKRRLDSSPGITGLAQLEFGNDMQYYNAIIEKDLEYIEKISLLLDIQILLKSFLYGIKISINKMVGFYLYMLIKKIKGLEINGKIVIKKKPYIDIKKCSSIIINENVTLNSDNKGHHVNMYNRVKLLTDRPNAKIVIGKNTRINGSCIHSRKSIIIGENCLIASNCQIIDSSGHDICSTNPENRIKTTGSSDAIVIGNSVWIGTNCIILPGVSIGDGSIIGAGSIVTKSIPPNTLAAGNPAKPIRRLNKK